MKNICFFTAKKHRLKIETLIDSVYVNECKHQNIFIT